MTTADCAVETEPAVTVKPAEVVPPETVTDDGTLSDAELLESPTMAPPEAAALDRTTVHVEDPPELRIVGEHESDVIEVTGATVMVAVCEVPL